MNVIAKLLLFKRPNKLSKQRIDYLLSALAIASLPGSVFAKGKDNAPDEGVTQYLVDVRTLLKSLNVEVNDINQITLTLDDSQGVELIALGNGLFQLIPTGNQTEISVTILGFNNSQKIVVELSLENAKIINIEFKSLALDFDTSTNDTLNIVDTLSKSWNDFINPKDVDDKDIDQHIDNIPTKSSDVDATSDTQVSVDFDMAVLGLVLVAGAAGAAGAADDDVVAVAADDDDVAVAEILQTLSGVISKGTLKNAQVFLDANSDGVLDWTDANGDNKWGAGEGEQWTLSNDFGFYELTGVTAADIASGTLVGQAYKVYEDVNGIPTLVSQTKDTISGSNVENLVMKADASADVSQHMITPLTTIVKEFKDDNVDVTDADILSALGLESVINEIGDINSYNPFSDEILTGTDAQKEAAMAFEKVASQILTTANTIAETVGSASDKVTVDKAFIYAVDSLVNEINKSVEQGTQIDFKDSTVIANIAQTTIETADKSVTDELIIIDQIIIENIADVVAHVNTNIESIEDLSDPSAIEILKSAIDDLGEQAKDTVAEINSAPMLDNDKANTDEDVSVIINVLNNDIDIDGDTLSVTIATADNGAVTINADDTLTYTGNKDFNGIDTITYTVDDGNGGTDTATVTVDVVAVNDQTTVTNSTAIVDEDGTVLIDLTVNATDIDGDALVFTSASAGNGTIDIATGIYTPNTNFNGTLTQLMTKQPSPTQQRLLMKMAQY